MGGAEATEIRPKNKYTLWYTINNDTDVQVVKYNTRDLKYRPYFIILVTMVQWWWTTICKLLAWFANPRFSHNCNFDLSLTARERLGPFFQFWRDGHEDGGHIPVCLLAVASLQTIHIEKHAKGIACAGNRREITTTSLSYCLLGYCGPVGRHAKVN